MTLIESLQTLANNSYMFILSHPQWFDIDVRRKECRRSLDAIETLAVNLGISMDDIDVAEIRRQYEWALEVLNE